MCNLKKICPNYQISSSQPHLLVYYDSKQNIFGFLTTGLTNDILGCYAGLLELVREIHDI